MNPDYLHPRTDKELLQRRVTPMYAFNSFFTEKALQYFNNDPTAPSSDVNVTEAYTTQDLINKLSLSSLNREAVFEYHQNIEMSGRLNREAIKEFTGTYKEHSRVDPVKASRYAEKQHDKSKWLGRAFLFGSIFLGAKAGFMQSKGDSLVARSLAGLAGILGRYPKHQLFLGGGKFLGAGLDYFGSGSTSHLLASIPFAGKEFISYPSSKFLGKQLIRVPLVRGAVAKGLEGLGAGYKSVASNLKSSWFADKSAEFLSHASSIRSLGNEYISGDLEKVLGKETLSSVSTAMQETIDPITDAAAFGILYKLFGHHGRHASHMSHHMAHSHVGVGEKGPASRYNADKLRTYRDHSIVDSLKTTILAEIQLGINYTKKTVMKEKDLFNNLISKYNITRKEFNRWASRGDLEKRLAKRGVSHKEIYSEANRLMLSPTKLSSADRSFLSKQESNSFKVINTMSSNSLLSGEEMSNRLTYDNQLAQKIGRTFTNKGTEETQLTNIYDKAVGDNMLKTEASITHSATREVSKESDKVSPESHVNVRIKDATLNYRELDRIITKKLKREMK